MRIAPLLLLIGCAHTTITRAHYGRYESPTVAGEPEALVLDASISGTRLHVIAQHPRRCTRDIHETDEALRHLEGDTGNGDGFTGRDGAVIGAVLGVITAAQVAGDRSTVTLEDRVVDRESESCPLPEARLPITVELPSGATLAATTNVAGFAELEVPPEEHGVLVIRGADAVAQLALDSAR